MVSRVEQSSTVQDNGVQYRQSSVLSAGRASSRGQPVDESKFRRGLTASKLAPPSTPRLLFTSSCEPRVCPLRPALCSQSGRLPCKLGGTGSGHGSVKMIGWRASSLLSSFLWAPVHFHPGLPQRCSVLLCSSSRTACHCHCPHPHPRPRPRPRSPQSLLQTRSLVEPAPAPAPPLRPESGKSHTHHPDLPMPREHCRRAVARTQRASQRASQPARQTQTQPDRQIDTARQSWPKRQPSPTAQGARRAE